MSTAPAVPVRVAPAPQPPAGSVRRRRRWDRAAVAFVAPAILLALAFLIVPLIGAVVYSTAKIASLSGKVTWVGLTNYTTMFADPTFYRALINTAVFIATTVPLSLAIGLALAVLMNSVLPGRQIVRTMIYLPLVISGVAVGLIGTFMYNETVGVINGLLDRSGLPSVAWQSGGFSAFVSLIFVTLWIRVGFTMIIYLAGLQSVPVELHESAQVEGASSWQRFRYITLPLLGPSTFFLLIMNVIYSFQVFDTVYVLTNGGPGNATEVLGTYAYKTAFGPARDQGYGAAIGIVIFALTLIFTILQWRNNSGRDEGGLMAVAITRPLVKPVETAAPRRGRRGSGAGLAIRIVLAVIVFVVMAFPLWVMVITAFSGLKVFDRSFSLWPKRFSLFNFTRVLETWPVGQWFVNSITITVITTILTVVVSVLAGYAFAKLRFPAKTPLFLLLLSTMMIPTQAILVPQFKIVSGMGLVGTFWAVIIPAAAASFGIFLARQFMIAIPNELIEAAEIDGAGSIRIFWSIILPLCKPLLAVLTLLSVMYQWNDFLWPLIVLRDSDLYTLPIGLQFLKGQYQTDYGALMAMTLLSVAPLVALFLAFQRFFVQGLATTGLK